MTTSSFTASYTNLTETELTSRADEARRSSAACTLCPRDCGIDRPRDEIGSCRSGALAQIASYCPHFGEERPLVGRGGSGTIFFTGCSLRCVYCQNYDISQVSEGRPVPSPRLGEIMVDLERMGCANINLVTPTHFVPQILEGLLHARSLGLSLPLVYNSHGYESIDTLRLLDGVVDIYMPDYKYSSPENASRLSRARDYPGRAKAAIKEMHRQVGDLQLDSEGLARRGLLVRHLVLPEDHAGTVDFIEWLVEEISPHTYLNLMDQYRPAHKAGRYAPLDRPLTEKEFRSAVDSARAAGISRLDSR